MTFRYIATVTAGRSGQASLARLLNDSIPGCFAAFEFPDFTSALPGALGDVERHVRRRFFETHELLGRGKVLTAFDNGDDAYLERIAVRRLKRIRRLCDQKNAEVFVDVSKYFARGLHDALSRQLTNLSLILLIRDPLENMRSFLNREKNFRLDNSPPSALHNQLRLEEADFRPGEFYLWSWFEMALRFQSLMDRFAVETSVTIRTDDLMDAKRMEKHFSTLELPVGMIEISPPVNTNISRNLPATEVSDDDRRLLETFLPRVPTKIIEQVAQITGYAFPEPALRAGTRS